MDDAQEDEFRHSGQYLRSLRDQAGMTLEEVARRAGVDPSWLDDVERNGTHGLLYSEICNLVRATQPPRPEWWDEGYEHDLNVGPNAVLGPLTPAQQEYWARIEAVRAEIRRYYDRGRRASVWPRGEGAGAKVTTVDSDVAPAPANGGVVSLPLLLPL